MREDFGIGFGSEIVIAVPNQLIFQRLVILDHAVVDECQFSASRRNGDAHFDRLAFPCVAQRVWLMPNVPVGGFSRHEFPERGDAPGALARFDVIAINDRDAGGIVAAIFEAAQTIEKDGRCLRPADVTDNATHVGESVTLRASGATVSIARRFCERLVATRDVGKPPAERAY